MEREFGRSKHECGLAPLRVRGLERVALHADLTLLARLSQALAQVRAIPLAAYLLRAAHRPVDRIPVGRDLL